jgi:hypothetical protein
MQIVTIRKSLRRGDLPSHIQQPHAISAKAIKKTPNPSQRLIATPIMGNPIPQKAGTRPAMTGIHPLGPRCATGWISGSMPAMFSPRTTMCHGDNRSGVRLRSTGASAHHSSGKDRTQCPRSCGNYRIWGKYGILEGVQPERWEV